MMTIPASARERGGASPRLLPIPVAGSAMASALPATAARATGSAGRLGRIFLPDALPRTARELEEAQGMDVIDAVAEQARREIADCDARLRQHCAALEAGADPAIVTGWMAETQARRTAAETRMRPGPQRQRITREEITRRLAAMHDVTNALATAAPADKAATDGQLGLSLTYRPDARRVDVKAQLMSDMYVKQCPRSESPLTYMPALTGELVLRGQS
jgi:hypothetical protein